jgi:hypothetical protein
MSVDSESFVRAWQQAASVQDVAGQFKLTAREACARAASLRRIGVPLKPMRANTGRKRLDVERLIRIARGEE